MSKKNITLKALTEKVESISLSPENEEIQDEEVWAIINSFVEQNGLNSAQLHSFNDFIHNGIRSVLDIPNIKHTRIEYNGKVYIMDIGEHYLASPKFTELNGEYHPLYPMEALWRNTTYGAELYVDVSVTPPSGEPTHYEKIPFGIIPVMVKSDLCNVSLIADDREELARHSEDFFDCGGYFVILSKNEASSAPVAQRRVLVSQERIANNQVFIFKNRKHAPKFSIYTECHSTLAGTHTTTTTVGKIQNRISCILPWIDNAEIPVGVLFKAFGVEDEKDMVILVLGPDYAKDKEALDMLVPVLEYSYECSTRDSALHFIGRRGRKFIKDNAEEPQDETVEEESDYVLDEKPDSFFIEEPQTRQSRDRESAISYAKHLLSVEVFSHLGQGEQYSHEKAMFLGYMVKKLMYVIMGRIKQENRDHYMNKRIWTTGVLLRQQFHAAMRRLIMEVTHSTLKALRQGHNVNITSWIKPSIITNALQGAISNNTWNSGGSKSKGISQIWEQYNYAAGIANMRKLALPIDSDGGKITEPRDIQGCHFGIMCPAETPEGKRVGLLRNLALLCYITIGTDPTPIAKIVSNIIGTDHINSFPASLYWARIFLNGTPIGAVKDPKKFIREMIKLRRSASINAETSIAYIKDVNEIHISTEFGRPCRPLLVVKDGELLLKLDTIESLLVHELTWSGLLARGVVELVDKAEEEDALVIGYPSDLYDMSEEMRMQVTHCELHPSLMYGIGGSILAFPDHNQSPRNCYQAAMGKQAIGIPFTNYRQMMTGTFSTMRYVQTPIAISRAATIIGFDELPAGQNAMTLIMPMVFNEEDSMEINQDSVDRGFMVSDKWTAYRAERKKEKGEVFGVPTEELCERFRGNASKLNEKGYVPEGTKVQDGDILIGKMVEIKYDATATAVGTTNKKKYINVSVKYEHPWPAVVDRIQIGRTGEGYEYITVMTVQERVPIVGDKFAARHGQKGIAGKLRSGIDLPFNMQGIAPDILLNALAFPSRMTIAMLIEKWTGKAVMSTSPLHGVLISDMLVNDDVDDHQDPDEAYDGVPDPKFKELFAHPKYNHLVDATPFRRGFDRSVIQNEMAKYGYSLGDEYWTDGITGKPTRCLAFFGPCFIQRLKHMVVDKVHARARGPRNTLTRQPKEGRVAGGGLRVGTMERDCMLAQGAARLARDRLMEQSDEFRMWICNLCGLPAHVEHEGRIKECRICCTTDVSKIRIPYGTKLIQQELMAENIITRVLTIPHWQTSNADNSEDK